jgi:histidyl-tRNA synthetase
MGDDVCRPDYLDRLRGYLVPRIDELCPEHRGRAAEHPLRVLDCKRDACLAATAGAPTLADHLCEPCRRHLARVLSGLDALGVAYKVDHRLVRGFDYYTRTTFEFSSEALGTSQNGIGGGGRYDGMVELLGGPPTPGIGFGLGIERILLACDAEGVFPVSPRPLDAFVVDTTGGSAARDLTAALRDAGLSADRAFDDRSMKAQFKAADRSGARWVLVVGPDEAESGTVSLRPLRGEGDQVTVPVDDVVDVVATAARSDAPARPTP